MDPRTDWEECVQIETARCEVRQTCMKNEDVEEAYGNFDLDTCIAYSKEHCRTRQIEGDNWDQKDIEACVKAILSLKHDCSRLLPKGQDETEDIGQCNFIENGDAGNLEIPEKNKRAADSDPEDGGAAETSAEDGGV